MIIFGTAGFKWTTDKGEFHCPQCNTKTDYRHRTIYKFFTLYFIPLIPLGSEGDFVQCNQCKSTFYPRVLNDSNDRENFQTIYETAIKHSMVLIMLADGVVDDREKEIVLRVINKFTDSNYSMEDLEQYILRAKGMYQEVGTYLKKVGPALNEHGKEAIIKSALAVASADGTMDDAELSLIFDMAKAMQMSNAHLKGVMDDFIQSSNAIANN